MTEEKKKEGFFRRIRHKRRLSIRDQQNQKEIWYMHISPVELIGAVVALAVVLFIIILTAAAYTPVLNLVPGYSGNRDREALIQNIMRVDSIERVLIDLQVYTTDVDMILDGKTPVMRNIGADDSLRSGRPEAIVPNAADSALRRQLESSGIYGLGAGRGNRESRPGTGFVSPVTGIVISEFDPREGVYGVILAGEPGQPVIATGEGTVIISQWTPDGGYIVQIQHAGNILSVYRNLRESLKATGERVRPGEVIGYTSEGSADDGAGRLEFELWNNGNPVDPRNYVVF